MRHALHPRSSQTDDKSACAHDVIVLRAQDSIVSTQEINNYKAVVTNHASADLLLLLPLGNTRPFNVVHCPIVNCIKQNILVTCLI